MTVAPTRAILSNIAILDSSSAARWLRRAWWGNRLLLYIFLMPAFTALAVLSGYPFSLTPDRADLLLRPAFLYGLCAAVLMVVVFWHIGRTDFHSTPIYFLLWSTLLVITILGPLLGNECVRDRASAACSPSIAGAAIEFAIYVPLSIWFAATWLIVARASFTDPTSGGRIGLFRMSLEGEGHRNFARRIWPTLLTCVAMLPFLGLVGLLRWQVYPALQGIMFPTTKFDELTKLTDDRGLLQLLALAAYKDYGAAIYFVPVLLFLLEIALLIVGYRLARRVALAWSGRFWAGDRTPSILLLRSFTDDGASVWPTSVFKRLGLVKMRLEEALGRELFRRGTLIAVGQPGERLPKLGAYRLYLEDDTWQSTVLAHINASAFVVVIGGTTKWVRWELDQIANSPNRAKLIYVLAPGSPEQRLARLGPFCDALGLVDTDRALIEKHAERILAISTVKDGRLCLCTGLPKYQSDFQIAAYIAMLAKGVHRD